MEEKLDPTREALANLTHAVNRYFEVRDSVLVQFVGPRETSLAYLKFAAEKAARVLRKYEQS